MKNRVRLYHDTRADQPSEITSFMHCAKCLSDRPRGTSPRNWARLNFGITNDGSLQVWCVRCDVNVNIIGSAKRSGLVYGDESQRITPGRCDEHGDA